MNSGAAILVMTICIWHMAFDLDVDMLLAHQATPDCQTALQQQKHASSYHKKMAIGVAANSCTTGQTGSAAIGGEEWDDRGKNSGLENGPRNGLEKGERNDDAAVEQRRVRDAEGMHLVALEPGQHVGPYRLQEHLGYLGSRPVHALDPAFHPYEVKRIAYNARGMLSATSQSSVCPAPPRSPVCPVRTKEWPWRQGQEDEAENDRGSDLIVKGGTKDTKGDMSYRLKKRFEGGSHGEVWRAVRLGPDGEPLSTEGYVLKRMFLEKGQHVMQAGIREIYFGELLRGRQGSPRIARYVEHLYLFGDHEGGRFGRAEDGGEGGIGGAGGGSGWDEGAVPTEMWLVFYDEGVSLRQYLYTEREAEGFVLHGQSAFWRDMRLDPKGPEVMKSILRQMLEGTRFLHERGILHRDLKPSNVIVSQPPTVPSNADTTNAEAPPGKPNSRGGIEGGDNHGASLNSETTPVAPWVGRRWGHGNPSHSSSPSHGTRKRRRGRGAAWRMGGGEGNNHGPSPVLLKVADFSSAVDEGAMAAGLYGAAGPAQAEETLQYAPPEVLFDPETAYSTGRPESYDVWSIGVILLELILGTPEVFTVDQRTRAILERDLAFEDDAVRKKAHLLAAMADMCIYSRSGYTYGKHGSPDKYRSDGTHKHKHGSDASGASREDKSERVHWPLGDRAVVDERCTLAELGKAVHTRDALDIGFPDQWGLDLLWRLLRWDPMERISLADALEHAYFAGPYLSRRDGSAHATRREAMTYDGWFIGSPHGGLFALIRRLPSPPHTTLWRPAAAAPSTGGDVDRGYNGRGSLWETKNTGELVAAPLPGVARSGGDGLEDNNFMLDTQHSLVDLQYSCPKCHRNFELWKSCHNHVTGRDHASFCDYDTSSLPPCVSSHSMLPFDPHSGWCDVQGRRSRIEDYHSIVFQEDYKFYGVFDGHCGTRAAKFASRALHLNLELFLNAVQPSPQFVPADPTFSTPLPGTNNPRPWTSLASHDPVLDGVHPGERRPSDSDNRAGIEHAVRTAFRKTQEDFLVLSGDQFRGGGGGGGGSGAPGADGKEGIRGVSKDEEGGGGGGGAGGADEDSGTTATVALVYPHVTVVAHVGDSRAVMCCDELGRAVDVTEDHTPYSNNERARVEASGGSVELRGVLRVNGELAVTRTIGNRRLNRHGVLSSEPDVVFISHGGSREQDGGSEGGADGGPDAAVDHSATHRKGYRRYASDSAVGGEHGQSSSNHVKRSQVDGYGASSPRGGNGHDDDGNSNGGDSATSGALFLVLASDGLWDVVSSQEAIDMVKEVMMGATTSAYDHASSAAAGREKGTSMVNSAVTEGNGGDDGGHGGGRPERRRVRRSYGIYGPGQAFQVAATALTHEAYVRGSTDNIGVCVVDLRPH